MLRAGAFGVFTRDWRRASAGVKTHRVDPVFVIL
jgi:hypothetical protein